MRKKGQRDKGEEQEKEERDFHSREEHLNLILILTKLKKRENFFPSPFHFEISPNIE